MTFTEQEDAVYEALLSCVELDEDVLNVLRDIATGVIDADELVERFDRKHITNIARRIEARVYESEPGVWVAEPKVGTSPAMEFATEREARSWIARGGHYPKPAGD